MLLDQLRLEVPGSIAGRLEIEGAGGEVWPLRGAENGADVFPGRSDAYRNMLLRLKQALDPDGIFNPGRLYSWL